jgi:hypothetical protein
MNAAIRPLFPILAAAAVWALAPTPAAALTSLAYNFFQDGYAEGATVTGSFTGADLDNNGLLIHFPQSGGAFPIQVLELTSWSMHFSGNSKSPAFDLALGDLFGFVYEIGSAGIGDGPAFDPTFNGNLIEGVGANGAVRFYTSGLGPNKVVGGYIGGQITLNEAGNPAAHALDSSTHLALVTPVPEPVSLALLTAAGLALAATARRAVN